jgi:hypothetical protein
MVRPLRVLSSQFAAGFAALAIGLTLTLATVPAFAQEAPPAPRIHIERGLLPEPAVLTTAFDFAGRYVGGRGTADSRDGFYPLFGGLYTGAGWLSVGGGYRHGLISDRVLLDGSGMVSWRGYKLAQGRIELPLLLDGHVNVGAQVTWQDLMQVNYFGSGPDSSEASRSEYRIKTTDYVAYAGWRPRRWLSAGSRLGWMAPPTLSSPAGPFDRGYPDARAVFDDEPAFSLDRQPGYLHGDLSVVADTRDYPSHPMSGGFYRAAWAMFSDGNLDRYAFRRYEAEAFHALPIVRERFTVLAHAWTVASDAGPDQLLPAYMLPSLGGSSTLRSFSDFRFHDRHMLLASVESRMALFTHVDAAVFVDAGNVAPRFGDLDLAKRSYGAGLRLHTHQATTARLDLATGSEGWRLIFSLNDPFRLRRLSRAATAVPFVP